MSKLVERESAIVHRDLILVLAARHRLPAVYPYRFFLTSGEAQLRRILTKYAAYYNELRTHRSLNKDAPIYRAIQHAGCIVSAPVLGGLHHHYCRI
jgi:transposase InsO family protein